MTEQELMNDPEIKKAIADIETDRVGGVPQIDLDETAYQDPIDSNYEIDEMMNDLILAEYADESEGEMKRDGIYLPSAVSQTKAWRVAKVLKVGPKVPTQIKPGCFVKFPANKGIPSISGKRHYIFLNAERIFCTLKKIDK